MERWWEGGSRDSVKQPLKKVDRNRGKVHSGIVDKLGHPVCAESSARYNTAFVSGLFNKGNAAFM